MMAASLLFYLYVEKPVIAALQRRIEDRGRRQVVQPTLLAAPTR
jgi:peptidoglycan/LPS O-acetylase OafA/YrhL